MAVSKLKSNQGFSLIELMIVLAIIGLLLVVALPSFERYRIKTVIAEAQQMALAMTANASVIYSDTGEFPGIGAGHAVVPVDHDYIRGYSYWSNGGNRLGTDGIVYPRGSIGNVQIYFHAGLYEGSTNLVRLTYDYMPDEFGNGEWLCVQHRVASLRMDEKYQPDGCQNLMRH